MKQNSSILFHYMSKPLRKSYLHSQLLVLVASTICVSNLRAADKLEYLASFDPAKGFKPAQADLTEVFLQIAGSLEYCGSPEPYLRHIKGEHERIDQKCRQRLGRGSKAYWPTYMTDEYFAGIADSWKAMAPKLGLETLSKRTGNCMRSAINGTRGNGTMLVEIFNHHQVAVFDSLAGKSSQPANFDALKQELISRLEIDKTTIHDEDYLIMQRDAIDFTIGIRGPINDLFAKLDASLNPTDAGQIKAAITSMFIDVGRAAQSELEDAIVESALDRKAGSKPVSVH